jgi:hypothetical protein
MLKIKNLGNHYNLSLKGHYGLRDNFDITTMLMLSQSDKNILNTNDDAGGYAIVFEGVKKKNNLEMGLLLSHASGRKDGNGFLIPMSFTKTNSYWGYTGIMTVMAQTDTGFASDSIHISNNGFGMSTIQAKLSYKPDRKTLFYCGVGYFTNTKTKDRKNNVGFDSVIMGAYNL